MLAEGLHETYICTYVSISSGQWNLMKTYHNDANTSEITKIALKIFWTFFDKEDRLAKLQKSDFQTHFSTSKIDKILLNFFSLI